MSRKKHYAWAIGSYNLSFGPRSAQLVARRHKNVDRMLQFFQENRKFLPIYEIVQFESNVPPATDMLGSIAQERILLSSACCISLSFIFFWIVSAVLGIGTYMTHSVLYFDFKAFVCFQQTLIDIPW